MDESKEVTVARETSFLTVIEKIAENPQANPEVIHRMIDAQERVMAKQAEMDYSNAMTRLQADLKPVPKNGMISFTDKNGQVRETPFTKYEDMDKAIRPLMIREGFTISFNSEPTEGGLLISAVLSHRGGHSKTAAMRLPLDVSGSKNNLQGAGSSISYGRRYLVDMLLNIIREGEDNDAQGAPIAGELVQDIEDKIAEYKADRAKFLEYMKVNDTKDILQKDYPKALTALKAKKKANDPAPKTAS